MLKAKEKFPAALARSLTAWLIKFATFLYLFSKASFDGLQ
jgi:hypothetical protein